MKGYIRTVCPECEKQQKVLVHFPTSEDKFEDTVINCNHCGIELMVTDTFYDE